MRKEKQSFRYESLQDCKSIRKILLAIADGIEEGSVQLSDDDDTIELPIEGLLDVKVTASKEDIRNRLTIRVDWKDRVAAKSKPKNKSLRVNEIP